MSAIARTRSVLLTAATFPLRRRRSGRRVLGRRQPSAAVRIRPLELCDGLCGPFFEAERSVRVGIELCESLATGAEDFLRLNPAVLVLVRAGETFLVAAFGAGLGRCESSERRSSMQRLRRL